MLPILTRAGPKYFPPCFILQNGGVVWTKGELYILGGNFTSNQASASGGMFFASEGSSIILKDGIFQGNKAISGGVATVNEQAVLYVEGGNFTLNVAENEGGVFSIRHDGNIRVSCGFE